MMPKFYPGKKVLVQKKWFFCILGKNDVTVLKDPRNGKLILKRINDIKDNFYYLLGDNPKESTDSRTFGWVKENAIIGKVISNG